MMHNHPSELYDPQTQPPLSTIPAENPVQLHPIEQEILELTGELAHLPLLLNPQLLANLRDPSSSVHTIETSCRNSTRGEERSSLATMDSLRSVESDDQQHSYRGYLLKPRMESYIRALEIYADVDGSFGGKFSTRLQACRKYAWFVQSSITKKLRVQSSRCKLRWCPICRDVSRMIVTNAVNDWLVIQKHPKMITLTLKHNDDPLEVQIKHLYKSFLKLRRRAYFQRLITGGVWFFQLKFNEQAQQWHPHIHCLVAGKYLPQARLKSLWLKITGDSNVVDIRPVKDLDSCSNEVARYATSPADITAVSLERSLEIHYATKHRRICGSWGSARSMVLRPKPLENTGEWSKVADFYFINTTREYDPAAQSFWKCFQQGRPYEGPQIQKLTEVFKDELNALDSTSQEHLDSRQWNMLIHKGRESNWTGFYAPIDHGDRDDGNASTIE